MLSFALCSHGVDASTGNHERGAKTGKRNCEKRESPKTDELRARKQEKQKAHETADRGARAL